MWQTTSSGQPCRIWKRAAAAEERVKDHERWENTRVQTDYAKKFFDQGMRHDGQYVF